MKISKVLTFLTFQIFFSGNAFTNLHIVRTIPKKRISLVDSTADSNGKKDDIEMPLSIKYYGDVSTQNCLFLTETLKKLAKTDDLPHLIFSVLVGMKYFHKHSNGGN